MKNNFASNGGQAAGRDIQNLSIHLGNPKPESQLQAEFAQCTGIWCPKPARERLESLMTEHRFTAKDLSVAWKNGSIGWNSEKGTLKVLTARFEALFAYGVFLIVSLYFLAVVIPIIRNDSIPPTSALVAYSAGTFYVGVCWMTHRFMLWPRRVAVRVKHIAEVELTSPTT